MRTSSIAEASTTIGATQQILVSLCTSRIECSNHFVSQVDRRTLIEHSEPLFLTGERELTTQHLERVITHRHVPSRSTLAQCFVKIRRHIFDLQVSHEQV